MGGPEGRLVDIDIDTGTVTVPIDLGIWRQGETLDVRLDDPTPVGVLLGDLLRLLGLPLRTWDGLTIDYWLHPAGEAGRLDQTQLLNEIDLPRRGLVLAASQTALDIRAQLDQMAKGIGKDIQKTINDEIQKGLDEVKAAVTGEITGAIRDIRERVTRQVTDLIPGRGQGVRAQFRAHIALRKVARTGAWVEYEDAVERGLQRAQRYASGAWRALGGLAATTGAAGAAGVGTAVATAVVVTTITLGAAVTLAKGDEGPPGTDGEPGVGLPGPQGLQGRPGPEGPPGTVVLVRPPDPTLTEYIVVPGDNLWEITEAVCQDEDATIRETVRRMLAIWVTNIEVVGRDPNSIDVGQTLLVPVPPCE